ncbi:uncharacterized protein MYCFIDRAFT_214569 [Pseudocercospora fijiensis CIRAD86]|uniref:SAP domain-containing protein n=1 Tax=Pseudocercospora fijiensis (strain CIRAD86) TaxID=383855 RepID=M3B3M0_PSEFD|nr:uncharacterized protein MYCFIDRAFT_214569 [Pseudocercospora fijiensis CIRAD86]EME83983.1 hypothetical protein MYCFIDRAFT_214569 [Pseudocercospora fijiensis CIRAD86]
MAAPRATQFIALRNLSRASQHVRHLHMTGPATYPSPILHKERPVLNLPRDIAALRAECKRRKIDASGAKRDLIARLNADELAHSRAFTTAIHKPERPTAEQDPPSKPAVRHFNTSRALKANNDSSTIDFAYLPDVVSPENIDIYSQVRVPIIPTLDSRTSEHAAFSPEVETVVMKPQISTMSADAVYMPFSEATDGHAMNIDFHAMADRVTANLRKIAVPVEQQAGIMKQILNDMVDDMMGQKKLLVA